MQRSGSKSVILGEGEQQQQRIQADLHNYDSMSVDRRDLGSLNNSVDYSLNNF